MEGFGARTGILVVIYLSSSTVKFSLLGRYRGPWSKNKKTSGTRRTFDVITKPSYDALQYCLIFVSRNGHPEMPNSLHNRLQNHNKHRLKNCFYSPANYDFTERRFSPCGHLKWIPSVKLHNPHDNNVQKIVRMTKMFTNPVYRSL